MSVGQLIVFLETALSIFLKFYTKLVIRKSGVRG